MPELQNGVPQPANPCGKDTLRISQEFHDVLIKPTGVFAAFNLHEAQ
jgi:hypothetical protein